MCGIYGLLRLDGSDLHARQDLDAMAAVTVHRGPDDEGALEDGPLAMGMRRLSIIDVEGGHQPIANEDGTISVVCNGEIYNFRELRKNLEKKGHRFGTGSDAEVAVHLYEEYGDSFVEHLRGMFALAVWDAPARKLLIARDRLGIKPLYFAKHAGRLIFASELKAVLAVIGNDRAIDRTALREYLLLGYVPAPLSIFENVRKLDQGSILTWSDRNLDHRRYWAPVASDDLGPSEQEWTAAMREAIESSVRRQLVSDVPLGAFLSGGLDSSSVVAMMASAGADPIRTYAIGFGGDAAGNFYNELPFARKIADRFGSTHREIVVEPDVAELLPRLLWYLDEPVADSAFVTTYLVANFARQDVKVILSGAGGDELFGGYRRYLGPYFSSIYRRVPEILRKNIMLPIAKRLPSDRHTGVLNAMRLAKAFILSHESTPQERYKAYISVFGDSHVDTLLNEPASPKNTDVFLQAFEGTGSDDLVQQCMVVDLKTQLPDDILMLTDRMTMATSLECRVPLLDEELVDLSLRMPAEYKVRGRRLKHVLKQSMAGILPEDIVNRGKRGFGAPMGAWLKGRLMGMTRYFLSSASVESRGLFDAASVGQLLDNHARSAEDNTDRILGLLNFEIWSRIYLDGKTPEQISEEIRESVV